MTAQLEMDYTAQAVIDQVERHAGEEFMQAALAFVPKFLATAGRATGEEMTEACKAAGIIPATTDKAFGAVYRRLSYQGVIVKCGFAPRTRGHGTSGGNIWKLSQ